MNELEAAIDEIMRRNPRDSGRLGPLAGHHIRRFDTQGLPGVTGNTDELRIPGLARQKDWDVAYAFAGKPRLLVSLKSIWKNAAGTIPNRIDDLMGEAANAQQLSPEIAIGYVMLFDVHEDSFRRESASTWSAYMEAAIGRIAIRKSPLWNQGLIEGCWFVRFDSTAAAGQRVIDLSATEAGGDRFIRSLLDELHRREPAIPLAPPAAPPADAR